MADRVAAIAGSTRGIGFALVRALASAWTTADTVYLTARRVKVAHIPTKTIPL